jgi:hypothetical protein
VVDQPPALISCETHHCLNTAQSTNRDCACPPTSENAPKEGFRKSVASYQEVDRLRICRFC